MKMKLQDAEQKIKEVATGDLGFMEKSKKLTIAKPLGKRKDETKDDTKGR